MGLSVLLPACLDTLPRGGGRDPELGTIFAIFCVVSDKWLASLPLNSFLSCCPRYIFCSLWCANCEINMDKPNFFIYKSLVVVCFYCDFSHTLFAPWPAEMGTEIEDTLSISCVNWSPWLGPIWRRGNGNPCTLLTAVFFSHWFQCQRFQSMKYAILDTAQGRTWMEMSTSSYGKRTSFSLDLTGTPWCSATVPQQVRLTTVWSVPHFLSCAWSF